MNKILYSPKKGTTGFCGIRGLPEEPNWNLTSLSNDVKKRKWRETLESCKSNSLEIVNPEDAGFHVSEITGLVTHRPKKSSRILNPVKPGDLFDLPEGYEFREEEHCQKLTHCYKFNLCENGKDCKKVLRLVKTETEDYISGFKESISAHEFKKECLNEPEPEESHIETEIECLSRRLRNNAELLINPHMYERVRMNLIEIAEQLVTIQRKKQ